MDPDACLKELLELKEKVVEFLEACESDFDVLRDVDSVLVDDFLVDVNELCNHVESLDGWMKKSGFLPKKWQKGRKK
jgi:hypothetical protein